MVAEKLKRFATDAELEREVANYPQLESFIKFDLQKDNKKIILNSNNGKAAWAYGRERREEN